MVRFALRAVAVLLALACVAILALVLAVNLPQAEGARRALAEEGLTQLWGEPVRVTGAVAVSLWPRVSVDMDGVEARGADGANARIDRLTVSISRYAQLLAGRLRYGLEVGGGDFDLPFDAGLKARPGSLLASPIHVLSLLPHLSIRDTVMRFTDPMNGWLFELKVSNLKSAIETGRNVLVADAALNGQALTLAFAFDIDVEKEERERPYGAQITLATAGEADARGLSARLDVRAPTKRFDHGLSMRLHADAGSLAKVLTLAGIAPTIDGTGQIAVRLKVEPDHASFHDLDLVLNLAEGQRISVTGQADDLETLAGAELKAVADLKTDAPPAVSLREIVVTRLTGTFHSRAEGMMLDEALISTNAFDQSLREIGPIRVRSVARDPEGHVAFRGLSVRAGPPDRPIAQLEGNVDDVLGLAGVELAGSIDIPVASVLSLPAEAQDRLGRIVGSLSLSDAGDGLGVDSFAARIDGSDLISADLALVLDELGKPGVAATTQVDARLKVPNYSAFAAALGEASNFRGQLGFEGRLSGNTDALTMEGRTDIGRTRINGTLSSLAAPGGRSLVKGTISSPMVYADELISFLRPAGQRRPKTVRVVGAREREGGSQLDLIGTTDADVSITATRLQGGGDSATGVQARLAVKDGSLRVDPMRIGYRGGVITGVVASEGRSVMRAKGSGQGWPLSSVLGRGSAISVSGTLQIVFNLTARMDAADPLATLAGTLTGRVGSGRIGTGLLDLAGVGIIAGIFTSSVQKGESVMRCAKVPLVFHKGVGRTNPVIVVNTENVQALARGTVDLVRNRIDLRVAPRPLNAPEGPAGHSFTVTGALSSPSIELASSGNDPGGRYSCK
ncbi:AsmA-like C-terminal region-containing protein [Xanthobacter autotrophicus DSM 597]|uniref:AsmA-like C-terminal region-containing protein n=1 Tax=Xanthobacter wiegelii TaxID=3119913 RepID=UPI00372ACD64